MIINSRHESPFHDARLPEEPGGLRVDARHAARAGHEIATPRRRAECLVVNTCAFIDRAREESVNTILELAQLKERGRARALIVTGCLTQRYGREI